MDFCLDQKVQQILVRLILLTDFRRPGDAVQWSMLNTILVWMLQ